MSFSGIKGWNTKPKPGVMLNPLHPLSRGLVGYWLFNEGAGSRAYDISGHGNHGTLNNISPNSQNSGWGGSRFGGGLVLDGTDDYVDCGDIDLTNFTIAFWIKTTSNPSVEYATLVGRENGFNTISKWSYSLFLYPTGVLAGGIGDGVSIAKFDADVVTFSIGTWYHVVMTYDKITLKFYIDGVHHTEDDVASTITPAQTANSLRIGKDGGASYFNGSIDNVHIYNRALSLFEIKQLYQNPFCNLSQVPLRRYSVVAPPVGAIMNQFQRANIGADLYDGAIIA